MAVPAEPAAEAGARRTDPLVLLRRCTMEGKKVRLVEDLLELDSHRVPRTAKCGFVLSGTFIDIGSVWYMLREISGDRPYTQDTARRQGFTYIGVGYRGNLCDWLVGKLDWCDGLVRDVVEGRKRPRDDGDNVLRSKRPRPATRQAAGQAPPDGGGQAGQQAVGGAPAPGHIAIEFRSGEISYDDVKERVRPVKDLDVLVRCPGRTVPNADLILKIAQEEVNNWFGETKIARPPLVGGPLPLIKELEVMLKRSQVTTESRNPIILLPCNKRAPVNMLNCEGLLRDGLYRRTENERALWFEGTRPECVQVVRNINGRLWTFELRDSTKNFSKSQWLRVVAVVTDGTEWQFKGWPFESVVDLFTTIKGIFFRESGKLSPMHVRQWAVSILEMAPLEYQHKFAELRDSFWAEVEKFMNSSRNRKFVNHTQLELIEITSEKSKPVL